MCCIIETLVRRDRSRKKTFQGKCFQCGEKGYLRKDCLARVIAHPTQTGKSEDDEDENGEKSSLVLLCLLYSGT